MLYLFLLHYSLETHVYSCYTKHISKFDVFHRRKRLYHAERSFLDKGEFVPVHDGEHLIYVNASKDVDELLKTAVQTAASPA